MLPFVSLVCRQAEDMLRAVEGWGWSHRHWGLPAYAWSAFLRSGRDSGLVPRLCMGKQRPLVAQTQHASEPAHPSFWSIGIPLFILTIMGVVRDLGMKDLGFYLPSSVCSQVN